MTAEDRDPYEGRAIRLSVGFRTPPNKGGNCAPENLRAICNVCASGLETARYLARPSARSLIEKMERISEVDQKRILEALKVEVEPK